MRFSRLISSLTLMTILVSCGKSHKALPVIDDSGISINASTISALKDNSINVSEIVDTLDSKISTITIPASKKYNPIEFLDGWYYFKNNSEFELPENIQVTGGRAGNHITVITLNRIVSLDSLATDLKCVYVGIEASDESDYLTAAKPYQFDFCVDGKLLVNELNYSSFKVGPENILDSGARKGTLLKVARADKITIEINDGNHKESALSQFISTEVEFVLTKKSL